MSIRGYVHCRCSDWRSTQTQLPPRFATVTDFVSFVPNSLSMLDYFRLDSTVLSNMGRTSGSGLVPIEGPTMQSGDQRCSTLQD